MPNFREIETLINNYSNKDWESFIIKEEVAIDFDVRLVDFISTNSREIFSELSRFIIAGDILITENIGKRISILKENLNSASIPDAPTDSLSDQILTQVSKSYLNWIANLESLNFRIIHHIEDYGSHWAFELFKESSIENKPLESLTDYSFALKKIIDLFFIDFFLSHNVEKQIPNLLEIRDRFQNQELFLRVFSGKDIVRNLLVEKCNLLINKIEKANSRNYKFSLNGREDIEHKNILSFNHYVDLGNLNALNIAIQRKHISTWNFKDYYVRMKILKEETKSEAEAKDLYESFVRLEHRDCCFDQWAHSISSVFLYNNYTSLVLSDENISLEKIEKILLEVSTSHKIVGIQNYFPYLKISQTIIKLVNKNIATIALEEITKHIKLLEQSNKALRASYEWSKSHLNWAFQPSFKECRYEIEGIAIFTASGYSTPIDYSYVENQIQKIKEESAIVKGFSSTLTLNERILEKSKETADEKIEKLQIENRELLKKNVEVLSIFAAIVLFVVGNIQLFAQLTSLKSALLFILVFAYIISMFVLLIRLTTRNYPNIKQSLSIKDILNFNLFESLHFGIMFIATIAILMMLKCSDDIDLAKKDSNDKNGEKVLIDIKSATTNQH